MVGGESKFLAADFPGSSGESSTNCCMDKGRTNPEEEKIAFDSSADGLLAEGMDTSISNWY